MEEPGGSEPSEQATEGIRKMADELMATQVAGLGDAWESPLRDLVKASVWESPMHDALMATQVAGLGDAWESPLRD
ncbi:hypothetical protein, partial [Asanoa iriomotensis]